MPPVADAETEAVEAVPFPVMAAEVEPVLNEAVRADRFMDTETDTLLVVTEVPIASVMVQNHTADLVWGAVPEPVQDTLEAEVLLMLTVASPLERLHA